MADTELKYARGTVWWCNLPTRMETNIQGGKRTVVIISSDNRGEKSTCFEVLAMTASPKPKLAINVPVKVKGKSCTVLASQHFTVDEGDMESYACTLTDTDMTRIEKAMLIAQGMEKYAKNVPCTSTSSTNTYTTMSDEDIRTQLAVAHAQLKVYKQQNDALLEKIDPAGYTHLQETLMERNTIIQNKDIEIAILQEKLRVAENRISYFTDMIVGSGVFGSKKPVVLGEGIVETEANETVKTVENSDEVVATDTENNTAVDDIVENSEDTEDTLDIVEKALREYREKGYKPAGFWDSDEMKMAFIRDYEEQPMEYVLNKWGLKDKHSASQTCSKLRKRLAKADK